MAFTVRQHASADEFLAAAGPFLGAREAEHNLLFGIAGFVRTNPEVFTDGPAHVRHGDRTARVASWPQRFARRRTTRCSRCVDELEAVDALVDALRAEDLPGLLGPTEPAARFAARWTDATGQPAAPPGRRTHLPPAARHPSRAPGARQVARGGAARPRADRRLAGRVHGRGRTRGAADPDPGAVADRWVAQVGRIGYVWEDGRLASSRSSAPAGRRRTASASAPSTRRPERRSRGYASSLTAAASQDQLDRGRRVRLPLHRSRQPDLEQDLPGHRLRAGLRRRPVPLRRRCVGPPSRRVLLAACATPVGEDRSGCGPEWLDVDSVVTSARGADESPLPIDCMHQIANRRVRVGFTLPAGPSCLPPPARRAPRVGGRRLDHPHRRD